MQELTTSRIPFGYRKISVVQACGVIRRVDACVSWEAIWWRKSGSAGFVFKVTSKVCRLMRYFDFTFASTQPSPPAASIAHRARIWPAVIAISFREGAIPDHFPGILSMRSMHSHQTVSILRLGLFPQVHLTAACWAARHTTSCCWWHSELCPEIDKSTYKHILSHLQVLDTTSDTVDTL